MNKAKVLMIGPDRSVRGGISAVVNNLFCAGIDKRAKIRYIGTMVNGSKWRKLLTAISAYFKAVRCIDQYDIVHIHVAADASYYRKLFFMKLALRHRKKLVIHQHGGDVEQFYGHYLKGRAKRQMADVFGRCDAFLVLNPEYRAFFGQYVPRDKIHVIPNGIVLPEIDLKEKEYGTHNILYLGRICREKGIYELFDAVHGLTGKYPDIHLYSGGIFEDNDLQKRILSDPEHISFAGWLSGEEKEKIFRKCPVFVLPSYFEGFGLSAVEAMARGCAVIASDVGGLAEIIQDDQNGILVPPGNSDAIRQAIDTLFSHPEKAAELGRNAARDAEKYDIQAMLENIVTIYGKVS